MQEELKDLKEIDVTSGLPGKKMVQLPIKVKYKNIIPVSKETFLEKDSLTGALASLLIEEQLIMTSLPLEVVETGSRSVSIAEVVVVLAGVCSSGLLFALTLLRS